MTPYLPDPAAYLVAASISRVTITIASTETDMTASSGGYRFYDEPVEEYDKVPDCKACKNKHVLPSGRMLHGRPVMVDCRSCSVHKNNRQGRRARKE